MLRGNSQRVRLRHFPPFYAFPRLIDIRRARDDDFVRATLAPPNDIPSILSHYTTNHEGANRLVAFCRPRLFLLDPVTTRFSRHDFGVQA